MANNTITLAKCETDILAELVARLQLNGVAYTVILSGDWIINITGA